MAELSKQALKVQNNTEFPNNNAGLITPSKLRAFNTDMIDSLVDEITYNADSASWNQSIDALEAFSASASGLQTGSLLVTASASGNTITFTKGDASTFNVVVATGSIPDISALNQATASLQSYTASADVKFTNLESTTASLNTSVTNINTFTASAAVSITNLNASSASQQVSIDSLNSKTGSYATTGSNTFVGANTFTSISASSFVSASEFIGNGSKITGITASISMPILDEGIPQGNAFSLNFTGSGISAIVVGGTAVISVNTPDSGTINNLTASFNAYTSSTNLDLAAIHQATASLEQFTASFSTSSLVSTSSFNAYTASNDQRVTSLEANSASVNTSITNVNSATASLFTSVNNINSTTASLNTSASLALVTASFDNGTRNLTFTKGDTTTFSVNIPDVSGSAGDFVTTSSFNAYTQSNDQRVSSLEANSASVDISITNLNASSASQQISIDALNTFSSSANQRLTAIESVSGSWITESETGSFASTGSNTFNGNQIVNGYVSASNGYFSNENITAFNVADGSNIRFWSGSVGGADYYNIQLVPGTGGDIAFSRSGAGNVKVLTLAGADGNVTTFQNNAVSITDTVPSFNVSAAATSISGSGSYTLSAATISEAAVTAQLTATSSVIGTFSVTGQSGGDGKATMLGHSGSLVLTNSASTPTYSSLSHISSSAANANTNLIFKTNTNTADTIISGSSNLFTNPAAPTAGFKRYLTGGNIAIGGSGAAFPQISGSMAWSPVIANNILAVSANPVTWRGPVSASASTLNNNVLAGGAINLGSSAANHFEKAAIASSINGNLLAGTINAVAAKTQLSASINVSSNIIGGGANLNMDSSSISFNGNSVQGVLTINNSYLPNTTTGTQAVSAVNGGLYIGGNTIYTSGSNTTFTGAPGRTVTNLMMIGTANVVSASLNGDLAQVASTAVIGQGLTVVGSNSRNGAASAADWGSVFVGRWNSLNGTTDLTAETIFAVGTGTGEATRKTGFLIDSGSNTFVEGSLNVSGSASFTGSVAGNVVSASITSNTASIDFNLASYFEVTSSVTPLHLNVTNIKPGTTATLIISASASSSILFSPNVAQPSGSAYSGSLGSIDVLSLVAFNTSKVNVVSTKALV